MRPIVTTDAYPLSPLQQGMLFHWLREPNSGTDIEQIVGELHEAVDANRLRAAWQRAVDSFDVLRTAFEWGGAEALQHIAADAEIRMSVHDLRSLATAEQADRLGHYLAADRRQGFDLA